MGFGDFLRGSIAIAELCVQEGYNFEVSYQQHGLGRFLKSNSDCDAAIAKPREILNVLDLASHLAAEDRYLFSNCYPSVSPSAQVLELVRNNCLTVTPEFKQKLGEKMLLLGLVAGRYNVIHVRTGDTCLHAQEDNQKDPRITELIAKLSTSNKTIIISDNRLYSSHHTTPIHLGFPHPEADIETTLLDFFLLAHAASIHQVSVYCWGSGFSSWVAKLYCVPLITHAI